ncbi:MAG: ABC transporter permease [Rhodospirillaceae bacterium]|nr:ABC transporter permease [Rhodospirillaceae bacterium]
MAWPVLTILLVLVAWELWIRLGDVPLYVFAAPSDALLAAVTEWSTLAPEAAVTMKEVALGFALAVVVGIGLALLIDTSMRFERAVYPYLVATQVIPIIALAPAIVIWFGYGLLSKVLIVAIFGVFVVTIDTLTGLRMIEEERLYLARSMGAGTVAIFFKIRLPHALPSIFGGVKLAAAFSVIGAVVAEFIGAHSGLGRLIIVAQTRLETVTMLAAIIWLAALGVGVYFLIEFIEKRAIRWHVSRRLEETHLT